MSIPYCRAVVLSTMLALAAGVTSAQTTSTGSGQAYPNKPIRIFTSEAGGGNDFIARVIAQGVTGPLGQPVVVENRVSVIATEAVAKAPPDGYTLMLPGNVLWILPLLRDNLPYDPIRDFSPITMVSGTPSLLVVHPSLPVKSVKELISLIKARPGEINYSAGTVGAPPHLAGELFKAMAGVNIVVIPYRGTGPAMNALMGGQVQLGFPTASGAAPHVKSGRLRALAVTSAQPSTLFPDLPTVAASGVPGYESVTIIGLFAPAKTPPTVINRLHQEIVRFLRTPEAQAQFLNSGVEALGTSPEQFAATIKSDMTRMGKVIKEAGIRLE